MRVRIQYTSAVTKSAFKFTVQDKMGTVLSVIEVPTGMYVSVIGRRQPGEQVWANPMSWWGDVTIRLQTKDRNKAEKKMATVNGEQKEVTLFEDVFQDSLSTMNWQDVILILEHPDQ